MSPQPPRLIGVDTRWSGPFGIGRYSHEVLKRLTLPWVPLRASGKPSAPLGALQWLPGHPRTRLAYSPGYNVLLQAPRQILTIHDLIHLRRSGRAAALHRAYYERFVKPVVRRSRVVLTVSETSRTAIAEWVQDDKVDVINAGIGVSDAFHPSPASSGPAAPHLLYIGNLKAHKNFDVVVQSLTRLPDLSIRVLVPEHERERAHALAQAHGVTNRFELLPQLSDEELATEYRGAAATLMPSTDEGFGLPALESVQCGTPVVYYAGCASVAETVGTRGANVGSAHDAEEWADAILGVVEAGARVDPPSSEKYNWDRTAARIDALLQERA